MCNILCVIGTRPQYIKIKPVYDFFLQSHINFVLADSQQHYDNRMSTIFIEELSLNISHYLGCDNSSPCNFLSSSIRKIDQLIKKEKPRLMLVIGDTNTTLAASIAANKNGIYLAHLEAGIRCQDKKRPEEINRIIVDCLSNVGYISRKKDFCNVDNPCYTGDMEYILLNNIEDNGRMETIGYDGYILMTMHRNENMNHDSISYILNKCKTCPQKIFWPIHHTAVGIMNTCEIKIPDNVSIISPMGYYPMVNFIARCNGIITDSGGITKIIPYFGKKSIILTSSIEWDEVIVAGYGKTEFDFDWLCNAGKPERDRKFYYCKDALARIYDSITKIIG